MDDPVLVADTWRLEFTQVELGPVASALADDLRSAGVKISLPSYKPQREPTLGTPEVILTIVVTAAAKALIVSGLHALEHSLENQIDARTDKRAQIILTDGGGGSKQRFPLSLRQISKDTLKEFVSEIVSAVDKF